MREMDLTSGDTFTDYFICLGKLGRKLLVSYLSGRDNISLNNALLYKEGRDALEEAYVDTVIKGFRFPAESDKNYGPSSLCRGLKWALDRKIDVREFTFVKCKHSSPIQLIHTGRRAMAIELFTRCTKIDDLNKVNCSVRLNRDQQEILNTYYGFTPNDGPYIAVSPLILATIYGDVGVVQALCFNPNVEVNASAYVGHQYRCALGLACMRGSYEVAKALLDVGKADPNGLAPYCRITPLLHATKHGHIGVVELLLSRGASPNYIPRSLSTALDSSRKAGFDEIAAILEQHGALSATQELARREKEHPLWFAVARSDIEAVKAICEVGKVDPNVVYIDLERGAAANPPVESYRDQLNFTPLMFAAEAGDTEIARILLSIGADLETTDKDGQTALHLAAENGRTELVDMLLSDYKPRMNVRDKISRVPIQEAAKWGHLEVVKILIEKGGVDLNVHDFYRQTPLIWAARSGHSEVVELLLKEGKTRNWPRQALHTATDFGNIDTLRVLLDKGGAHVDEVHGASKDTCLHRAACMGRVEVAKMLIEDYSANIEAENAYGDTPLHKAAGSFETRCHEVVELLCKYHCNVRAVNYRGETALSKAAGLKYGMNTRTLAILHRRLEELQEGGRP